MLQVNDLLTVKDARERTLATACSFLKSYAFSPSVSLMKAGRAIEAKLQTATSSGAEYSMISVHRLELLIVPRLRWFDLAVHKVSDDLGVQSMETSAPLAASL